MTTLQSVKELSQRFSGPRRLISFDYYDGTTSGVIRLDNERLDYRYDLVSWDGEQNRRIFCISPLDAVFDNITDALSPLGKPTWPCWYPVWKFSSESQKRETEHLIDFLAGTSSGYVNALLTADLCKSSVEAIALSGVSGQMAEEFRRTHIQQGFHKWISFFGKRAD
jgi:hypothetical protein